MTDQQTEAEDDDRADAVLRRALELVRESYIPMEVIMLTMLLRERLDPMDGIVAAYLLGRCDGDIDRLNQLAAEHADADK